MPKVPVNRGRAALNRQQARAVQTLVAAQEKVDDLGKMLEKAEKARDRAILRSAGVGINHAEIGRLIGLSKGRVWQLLKAMGAISPKGEVVVDPSGAGEGDEGGDE